MAGKPPGDRHRALLCQGKEDEMEVFGYKAQGLQEALCVAGYVLSCGALWLVFYWKPEWGVWATCRPCHLEDADTVLLRTTDEFRGCVRKKVVSLDLSKVLEEEQLDQDFRADNGCVIRRAVRKPDWKVRYIQVQKIRYVWDVLGQEFVRVGSLEDSNTCHDIHHKFGDGLTRTEKELRKLVCGPNTIEIEIRPVWNLLFKEVLNPFYLFQGFTLTLWLSQGYYEYASAILILTFITIAVTVYDLRQQSVKLHNLVEEHNKVEVTAWTKQEGAQKMESCHLVPGDVLLLEGQKFSLPCDAILLEGSCVVDEGMLTGESVPVTKTALPHADQATPWKRHGSEDYRRHVLFCGTEIIQTRRAGKGPARAIVLQTGFNTAKGDLVRSILYPKPLNLKLHREAFKFILCLLAIGIVGLVYAACVYAAHKEPVADTVVMALLLLTTAVPPALPVALTTGTAYAQRRLKAKRIFCISPQRINICGQVNLVCFDKTGTLTEDGLNLWGIIPCQKRSFQNAHTFSAGCPLPWSPLCAAMATCHSLLLLEGKIQGDPLDLEMFQGTCWEMEESSWTGGGPAVEPKETCQVVKPGPAASQAPVEGLAILRQFPFSSSLLRMSVIVRELGRESCELYMKGAPETVAGFCKPETVPEDFQAELKHFTRQGFRVIALAHKELPYVQQEGGADLADLERDSVESELTFLGLLVMENRLKSETKPVLEELSQARIRSVMVTGDNLQTAITVAKHSGMVSVSSRVILVEASEPEETRLASLTWQLVEEEETLPPCKEESQDQGITVEGSSGSSNFHFALSGTSYQVIKKHFSSFLPKILINATVFARMSPGQKSSLVEEFQKLDYCVGMCGDGANDCGALKMAHAGISLSEQEASVASPFTSQTPNIECVPELIREGRAALVSSFAVFKYITLYALQAFLATALLYWQIQIMGNYQYLVLDGISLAAMITMSLSRACPKLAPYRPPGRLLSPPLMLSVALSVGFSLAVQTVGFLLVKQQPWYAQVRSYRGCPSGNQPLLPANGTTNATAEEHRVLGYEDTTLFYLTTFDVVMVAFVFSQGRPFRKPIYTNYLFSCLLCLQLGICFFLLFADLEAVYRGLELLCTPVLWRLYLLVMLLVKFLVSFFVEDALLQNYALWLWVKALFRYHPSSQYRRLQRQLEGDASWPPVDRRDLLATLGKSEAYLNPVYEGHGEEEEVPGGKQPGRGPSDAQAGI